MFRGICETPNEFSDVPDHLNGSREPPYLTNSAMNHIPAVTERYMRTLYRRISRSAYGVKYPSLYGPSRFVDLKIFLREHGIEGTKLPLNGGLEWAKMHKRRGIEVRPRGNEVEACGDRSSRGIDERHFVL